MRFPRSVWIGFDPREVAAFAVARHSARRRMILPVPIHGLVLRDLRDAGLYNRPTSRRDGRLWDDISDAPMATEFAISRFLVPHLAREGLALFMDCDMLVRADLGHLFDACNPGHAVTVVQHVFEPPAGVKMDGQAQLPYARKNWSSVMVFNCDHPANRALTVEMVNSLPGRDLHRFCWLDDDQIGAVGVEWNWLAGHSDPAIDPAVVHHTDGIPTMPGYEDTAFAGEWREELELWAGA